MYFLQSFDLSGQILQIFGRNRPHWDNGFPMDCVETVLKTSASAELERIKPDPARYRKKYVRPSSACLDASFKKICQNPAWQGKNNILARLGPNLKKKEKSFSTRKEWISESDEWKLVHGPVIGPISGHIIGQDQQNEGKFSNGPARQNRDII